MDVLRTHNLWWRTWGTPKPCFALLGKDETGRYLFFFLFVFLFFFIFFMLIFFMLMMMVMVMVIM